MCSFCGSHHHDFTACPVVSHTYPEPKSKPTMEDKYKKALEEIYDVLKRHPTNMSPAPGPLQEGYDSLARYAYLVAKNRLDKLNE